MAKQLELGRPDVAFAYRIKRMRQVNANAPRAYITSHNRLRTKTSLDDAVRAAASFFFSLRRCAINTQVRSAFSGTRSSALSVVVSESSIALAASIAFNGHVRNSSLRPSLKKEA